MDKDTAWQRIHQERAALADLLETLPPAEWEHPSLCAGWTVRDVAAHVIGAPQLTIGQMMAAGWRGRGNINRVIHDEAKRMAGRPSTDIVADFRRLDRSRRVVPGLTYREALLESLVHLQDIAIPLKRPHEMPVDGARDSATRVWGRWGSLFRMKKTLSGLRLEATDTDWAVGDGPAVRGPISALLLLLTGRPVALPSLEGDGLHQLRERLEVTR